MRTEWRNALIGGVLLACTTGIALAQDHGNDAAFLPSPVRTVSTTPANGDQNPYGVAFVRNDFQTGSGPLKHGDILVSNFNNSQNLQGTGTTIVRVPATGSTSVFFQGSAGLGLSTALGTLQAGFVVVGNAPTTDGTSATAMPGSLLVINNQGKVVQSIANDWIQYPWDMALIDQGNRAIAFVTNALNGTVSRLDFQVSSSGLKMLSAKTIASGYEHRGDPVALFVSPTGLVYDGKSNRLYVASTGDNALFAISDAATRTTDAGIGSVIYQDNVHMHGALGLAEAPNGHLLVSNNDTVNPDPNQPSEIVEFTKQGDFVKELSVDPNPGGSFGLAVHQKNNQAIFAAVDDNTASLIIWTLSLE
jgi:DNA-binding beta-propeller fold protein YncE